MPSKSENLTGKEARSSFKTSPIAPDASILTEPGANWRFQVLTDGILRYEWASDGKFEDRASTLAVNRNLSTPQFEAIDRGENGLEIKTRNYQLNYDKRRFSPGGLTATISSAAHNYGRWRFEGGFGIWRFGEVPVDDLGGTVRTLDGVDGRMPLEGGILGRTGFAFIDDSRSMLFDGDAWIAQRMDGDRIDGYLFAYGREYRDAIKDFYRLSGPTPLLPRWALGNWWSRYWPYTSEEYLDLMDRFKHEKVPLSVGVMDMAWHLIDHDTVKKSGSAGWTGYTWDKDLIPDPKALLQKLKKRGLQVSLNDHPAAGIYDYEDSYKPMLEALGLDTSDDPPNPIPFDSTNRVFMEAFFDIVRRPKEEEGVRLFWLDWQQGRDSLIPGTDPLWVLNHYSYLDNAQGGKRPINFSRYAGPGSHRYPIGFSGDTYITWKSLEFQPEFTATASNIAMSWWSNDIGGHMGGTLKPELHTRWLQLGVFSPILRLHSTMNTFLSKEPWNFSPEHEIVQKKFLQFRHRLLPYLYSMNVRTMHGEPLIQPMYWTYPVHGEAYEVPNQYNFGSNLIVAAITCPADERTNQATVRGWLPPGEYVDIFTELVYSGDGYVLFSRPLANYPVLAPAGSIVPLDGNEVPDNGCPAITKCELLVAVGADGRFEIHEDDGGPVEDMVSRTTVVTYSQTHGVLTIAASKRVQGLSDTIDYSVRFLAGTMPSDRQVSCTIDGEERGLPTNPTPRGFTITIGDVPVTSTTTITIGANPALRNSIAAVKDMVSEALRKAEIENELKVQLWEGITKADGRFEMAQRVHGLSARLGKEMTYVLLEILLAHS